MAIRTPAYFSLPQTRSRRRRERGDLLDLGGLVLAALATLAPIAHVLEMPNKLSLSGPLWLEVQQHLYRGWGPFLGPFEIGALVASVLLLIRRRRPAAICLTALTLVSYTGMLASFFLLDSPVNTAVMTSSPNRLPARWQQLRLQWELGHAAAAGLSIVALLCLIRADRIERRQNGDTVEVVVLGRN